MGAMSEVSFSVDPSGLSTCGQGMAGPEGRPPKNWRGIKAQCVNRLGITKMGGFEPVALMPRRVLRVDTLYRKGRGFWVRWRLGGIVAHGEHRDDAVLALLAAVRDRFLELSQREETLGPRELVTLRSMRQFLKIEAEEGESALLNGDRTVFTNYLGPN